VVTFLLPQHERLHREALIMCAPQKIGFLLLAVSGVWPLTAIAQTPLNAPGNTINLPSVTVPNSNSTGTGTLLPIPNLPAPQINAPNAATAARLPDAIALAVRQDLSRRLGLPIDRLTVSAAVGQTWPDGCLGLANPGEVCTQAIVPGWRVTLSDGNQSYIYRTDDTGRTVRSEERATNPTPSPLSKDLTTKLLQQVASDTKISVKRLSLVDAKATQFDGCLGIFRPNQACTRESRPGFQTIVTNNKQVWIYHLTANGDRIEQNDTASRARNTVKVGFIRSTASDIPLEANAIFRSTTVDTTANITTTVTLFTDGRVIQSQSGPTIKVAPVVLRTLSNADIAAFQQLLTNQRFPNFNGLSYLTNAVGNYSPALWQSQLGTVQLVDVERRNLPGSLQTVLNRWTQISKRR
jgi:hypothetical protein